ncbi:CC chemokine vCCL3 [Colobine gammaherpesvirus 1]|uniref:CC chemokine vCCL3 n=1 Tax=Colobine gammaherpesvirus 1 TaxID=2597325 RepID=A0A5B8FKF6_9GAMA|nr:CC chemokine vCCL3 [Colobine gammaherpesvirus 1]QDQ69222.1 CC chemokine vCCL3 [Colobine gammaherpesvirus 1]
MWWRGLLLLGVVLWGVLWGPGMANGPATIMASDCCEHIRRVRFPTKNVVGWYLTSKLYCEREAVIFVTRTGYKFCAWSEAARTRHLMDRFPEMSFREITSLRRTKSRMRGGSKRLLP